MAISKPFAYNPSTSFSIGSGFDNSVYSVVVQSDGKILVGGDFTTFSGSSQNYLIRLNSDGSKDTSFNIGSGFDAGIFNFNCVKIQSNGKILVGGEFTTYQGSSQNYLIRLNSDGSKDATFDIGSGFNSSVGSLAIQSDGKILVGGFFSTFSGSSQNRFIRLNSDGSKDESFDVGSGFANLGFILSIVIQSDGKILVGGYYTTYKGLAQNYLIRLNSDGSKDETFVSVITDTVVSMAIQSDGKILVAGWFGLKRVNSDGTNDATFNIGSGFNDQINSISIQSDGKIIFGGNFTEFTGSTQNRIIRLNSNGSKDSTFNIGTGFSSSVYSVVIQSDGKILAGGGFTTYSGSSQNYLTKLNSDGSIFSGGTAPTISGTTQYGDLVVGDIQTEYSINYGGVKWWGGPDEELGYVVGNARPDGQSVPAGVTGGPAYVGFWRSELLTDNSFLNLANYIGSENGQPPFASTNEAVTWLNANGYYSSFIGLMKYYVGGQFTVFGGVDVNKLVSLNTDGSQNTLFDIGSGFNDLVNSTAIQSDGKVLVGGDFTTFNGSSQNRLIRLNTDGSKDTSFNIGTGFVGNVYSIAIQSDGKILVGGSFYEFTGSTQNKLIRLNSDGSKDETFDIGSGFNSGVYSVAVQSDGKILVGGNFSQFNGTTQKTFIRLNSNGSKDSSFNVEDVFNGSGIYSILVQSDGKILVGGEFTTFTGSSQNYLIRLNTDGSKDETFDIGSGFNSSVMSMKIQSDGKILAGGYFTTFTGSSQNRLIRLNSDGSKDTSFDIGTGFVGLDLEYGNCVIRTIEVDSSGKIICGGVFGSFSGISQSRLIRLNSDGSKDTTFDIGYGFDQSGIFNFPVIYSVKINSVGKLFIGGYFSNYSGTSQNLLMSVNSNNTKNTNFDIGSGFESNGFTTNMYSIEIQSDGKILVGGDFTTFSGSSQNLLIRLNSDGSKDETFNIGSGFGGPNVRTLAIQSDGKILAGGLFFSFSGESQNYLIRLNSDGSKDTTFNIGDGFNSDVISVAVQSDGKILVGGDFTTFSGSSQNKLIRLNSDGSKDETFNIGSGFDSAIQSIAIQSDGKILVGGQFTTFTGSTQNYLIRLNTDGSKDTSFNIGDGFSSSVRSIQIQSDGKILVGGDFTQFTGSSQNYLIRLNSDGSKDSTFNIGTGFDNFVYSVDSQSDGTILVGGDFITYNGSLAKYSAVLNDNGSFNSSIKTNKQVRVVKAQ
jgi:uncharacterized delta-60 repeat protein